MDFVTGGVALFALFLGIAIGLWFRRPARRPGTAAAGEAAGPCPICFGAGGTAFGTCPVCKGSGEREPADPRRPHRFLSLRPTKPTDQTKCEICNAIASHAIHIHRSQLIGGIGTASFGEQPGDGRFFTPPGVEPGRETLPGGGAQK
jgi:hypothetical protein